MGEEERPDNADDHGPVEGDGLEGDRDAAAVVHADDLEGDSDAAPPTDGAPADHQTRSGCLPWIRRDTASLPHAHTSGSHENSWEGANRIAGRRPGCRRRRTEGGRGSARPGRFRLPTRPRTSEPSSVLVRILTSGAPVVAVVCTLCFLPHATQPCPNQRQRRHTGIGSSSDCPAVQSPALRPSRGGHSGTQAFTPGGGVVPPAERQEC